MNAPTNFIPETFKQNSKNDLAEKTLRNSHGYADEQA